MAYYVPKAITQRKGNCALRLRNNNCTMATAAAALDYQTSGRIQTSACEMRARQHDQVGGTDLNDAAIAWRSFGHVLRILGTGRQGVKAALAEGRCVMLPVDSGKLPGNACSKSQDVAHSVLLHPQHGAAGKVYVMDPWCDPGKWVWMDRSTVLAAMLWTSFATTKAREG